MSILIKGMEIPRNCEDCMLRDELANGFGDIISEWCPLIGKDVDEYGWKGKQERHPDCPLVEVPEPHGRLIEAPEIEWEAAGGGKEISLGALIALAHKVDNAPTVIEAEGEDHE